MGLHYKDRDGQVLLEQEQKIIFSVLNMLMDMEHIICLYERDGARSASGHGAHYC